MCWFFTHSSGREQEGAEVKKNLKEITRINNPNLIIIVFFLIVLSNAGMRNKEWPGSLYCVSNPGYVVYTIYALPDRRALQNGVERLAECSGITRYENQVLHGMKTVEGPIR